MTGDMKKMDVGRKAALAILMLAVVIPAVSYGALVTCQANCGWNDLMAMVNRIMKFLLFKAAIPIAAIGFAYVGLRAVFAPTNSEVLKKLWETFMNIVIGLLLFACAWLIVRTILMIAHYNGSWIGF